MVILKTRETNQETIARRKLSEWPIQRRKEDKNDRKAMNKEKCGLENN